MDRDLEFTIDISFGRRLEEENTELPFHFTGLRVLGKFDHRICDPKNLENFKRTLRAVFKDNFDDLMSDEKLDEVFKKMVLGEK